MLHLCPTKCLTQICPWLRALWNRLKKHCETEQTSKTKPASLSIWSSRAICAISGAHSRLRNPCSTTWLGTLDQKTLTIQSVLIITHLTSLLSTKPTTMSSVRMSLTWTLTSALMLFKFFGTYWSLTLMKKVSKWNMVEKLITQIPAQWNAQTPMKGLREMLRPKLNSMEMTCLIKRKKRSRLFSAESSRYSRVSSRVQLNTSWNLPA